MADYKVPNLCGTSIKFNASQSKFDIMISNAIGGLEVDASTLKVTISLDNTSLIASNKAMMPELPALSNVSLQAQLTSLSGLSVGSSQYNILLAGITLKFGSALTADGYSLDTLVLDSRTAITGGTDLCSAVPNYEVPAAGGDAVERSIEVLQAEVDSEKEMPSVQLANPNVTSATTNASSSFNNFFRSVAKTGTLPTTDTGSYTVTTNSTTITSSAGGPALTGEVTTPKDATVVDDNQSEKNNISDAGFSSRPIFQHQSFTKDATSLELEKYPAGGYAPRMHGFIDLSNTNEVSIGLFTENELKAGYARRRIYPAGHINSTVDGIKIMDEYSLVGKVLTIEEPRLFNYTGWYQVATGRTTYFQVLYKYNSKYDPN